MAEYEFDVALSYAGEDQRLVLPVVELLKDSGVEVFHGKERETEMWGLDLVEYFSEAFSRRARYVLLFGSRNYVDKWSRLQRRTALGRALEQHTEYVLPIRVDDTAIPGLSPHVGYLDLRVHSAKTIAEAVVQKLAQHRAEFTPTTPVTAKSVAALVREKPHGWEYLLYATVVAQGLADLQQKYREHFLRYSPRNGIVEHGNGIDLIRDRNVLLGEIIKVAVESVFTADTQEAAFGRSGEPGDADRIVHLGELFVRTFDEILEWARGIHGTSYAHELARAAARVQARFADRQLEAMHAVARDLREVADTLVERLTAGERIDMTVPLVFEVEPALELEFKAALDRLSR
ncbi:toll/interleukin-1 receptor domain-containing protein [Lentzea flaviverrucosa]|uniref:TIR domain-containing protein n=1 Tax=Lentzea flaviverrucosa TaxID=200379 RepID=A0A1H9V6M7_9PSEU|nr:TIR domain-containing protein [Lentzea flaviverrucosa]RDI27519.1 TIR domain-containing protein [Lentzea flaviverrucosa]SES17191.1 TIR domain-containing protein [Lentzea flaviverrucosa]